MLSPEEKIIIRRLNLEAKKLSDITYAAIEDAKKQHQDNEMWFINMKAEMNKCDTTMDTLFQILNEINAK